MPEVLIIANPTSGSLAAPKLATRVAELLRARGASVELKVTAARGDAQKFAAAAASAGVVCVAGCGGDGTLQEIATALEGSTTALGILPGGRCNDFAQALGLSKNTSAEILAAMLAARKTRAVDLGAMGSRRFLTVATLGFDSAVSRFVENRRLWVKGTLAYLYGVARILPGYEFPHVRLSGDFGVKEGRMLLAATGNAGSYGGAMKIAPEAKIDDGLFDVCVVEKTARLSVLRILPQVLSGGHTTHPAVSIVRTRTLEIETPGGAQFICADGETLGQTPCRFEVRPGALRVVCGEVTNV